MKQEDIVASLRKVSFFAGLDEMTLAEVARQTIVRRFAAQHCIVTELEFGDEVFVIARGRAQITVCPQTGEHLVLSEIGPGAAFGEMSTITGELRSATVRALTPVEVLVLSDEVFDWVRARRPDIATSMVHTMAGRLVDAERTIVSLLNEEAVAPVDAGVRAPRSTLTVLWHELVVNHHKDLAFLALVAFVATLIVVRLIVFLAFKYDVWSRDVLRIAYVTGFGLVMLSACGAILTFRPRWRRIIVTAFGVGAALIVNELGVTLAFDIYYKDSYTLDPNVAFDIERLYRRTEPVRAIVVGLVLLLQAVYLGSFYRRVWHLFRIRVR